jgi:hypothetical protein
MSKMYLWVLTLATKSEPTLIGQLALSLQTISILDVASSSIALWAKVKLVNCRKSNAKAHCHIRRVNVACRLVCFQLIFFGKKEFFGKASLHLIQSILLTKFKKMKQH